jgi:zinc protease
MSARTRGRSLRFSLSSVSFASFAVLAAACGGAEPPPVVPPPPAPPPSAAPAPVVADAPGSFPAAPPRPSLPPPFQPAAPTVYTTPNGMTVWLLERHTLPVVALTVTVPTGATSDPKGQAGLAEETAEMLGEGAGKRDAVEYAKAIDQLGATISSYAIPDASFAQLSVVKRNFVAGVQLLADAVARPRFDPKEWKRVHDLWRNDLKERASDPGEVARVVELAVAYGPDHPYGHPVDGLLATAPRVTLPDAKRFYAQAWRPDRATIVAVGDLTRAELDAQLDAAFGTWKAPAAPPLPVVIPPPPAESATGAGKARIVFVDRPDAPQAYVQVIRPGLAAGDPRYPPLTRANIALGGSFTSRLNSDLREKHGWTYGAGSGVTTSRGVGTVREGGAFVTEHAVEALKALLADVDDFTHAGMTEDEAGKTRLQARSDMIHDYETVEHTSAALAHDAALGLGPDWEAKASLLRDGADRGALNKLAATFFDRAGAAIVIVGPRAKLEGQLAEAGFGPLELRDTEGNVETTPAPPAPKGAK